MYEKSRWRHWNVPEGNAPDHHRNVSVCIQERFCLYICTLYGMLPHKILYKYLKMEFSVL